MKKILGIETSCDETAASVVADGLTELSGVIASQADQHAAYGGVIPELAAREHLRVMDSVVKTALKEAGISSIRELDGIAVTQGPGLVPALLVGLSYAKGLSATSGVPLVGVNHFLAHIYGALMDDGDTFLQNPKTYPAVALVVSGGHSAILVIERGGAVRVLGQTLDDAAGEAFDKAAKLLELGYPGGPVIQKTGAKGDPQAYRFPRSLTLSSGRKMRDEDRFNFSFSGLKTALLYHCRQHCGHTLPEGQFLYDTVASYQEAIVDVLVRKTMDAVRFSGARTLICAGGVACNGPLRERLKSLTPQEVRLALAPPKRCTDNAVMVAGLGFHLYRQKQWMDLGADVYAKLPQVSFFPPAEVLK